MLIEFSVENFLSLKERATLSMVASKDDSHENNTIKNVDKGINVLKTAAIYGANASGKTNVIKALSFFKFFLQNSHEMQQDKKVGVETFKLDRACHDQPSRFDIVFKAEGIKYAYGFSATEESVIDEYLYYYPKGRQSTIFEREDTDKYKFTNDVELQTQIKDRFHSPNKLYISTASLWEYEKTKVPFKWLNGNLNIFISHAPLQEITVNLMKKNEVISRKVKALLKKAITDIEDIEFREIDIVPKENILLKYLNEEGKSKLYTDRKLLSVNTLHRMNDSDELVEFDLDSESDGTKKLFGLLGPWVKILEEGSTIIVDELDNKLHSHLTRYLVELFHNPIINKNNAQLIFSTHDTNLLDQDLFRRDQIWFTEKKEDNSTDLYSLDDFPVRKDAAIEKGYLQGKYGAIPYIKGDCQW